jgi:hypothetical protein
MKVAKETASQEYLKYQEEQRKIEAEESLKTLEQDIKNFRKTRLE